jgi:hypothetical protein
MAREIRSGFSRGVWPDFKIESQQTRLLIDFMKAKNRPVWSWEEVVAPHAHHYFPRANYVGVQYPPGTGLVLAMFPQGEAVYDMNRIVVFAFVVMGVAVFVIAVWKRGWASMSLVALTLCFALMVVGRLGALSFSMNVVLVPILVSCLFSLFALWFQTVKRERLALLFALLAGAALGFATLIRLPSFLLAPGFLILLWPGVRNFRVTSLPLLFAVGVTIAGVAPVLINQHYVAGAWYLSTYSSVDAALPSFADLRFNLWYYFTSGPGAVDNWALVCGLVGFIGVLLLYVRRGSEQLNSLGLSWKRLTLAVLFLWVIPIAYFLTHVTTAPYYMVSSIFATVALAGFGSLALEISGTPAVRRFEPRKLLSWLTLLLILLPGVVTFKRAWSHRRVPAAPETATTHRPILLPAELADDKAWIWADLLTGSLWYYANKPAFKYITDEETRAMLLKFVSDRGEKQYLIDDSANMKKYVQQIEGMGGKLEMRGKVDGQPYYLVTWPSEGPK